MAKKIHKMFTTSLIVICSSLVIGWVFVILSKKGLLKLLLLFSFFWTKKNIFQNRFSCHRKKPLFLKQKISALKENNEVKPNCLNLFLKKLIVLLEMKSWIFKSTFGCTCSQIIKSLKFFYEVKIKAKKYLRLKVFG